MKLATYEDFNGGSVYTHYPLPDEVYDKRARLFYFYPEPILVVGCGCGGLVRSFRDLKKQAWGVDAAQYVIDNRDARVPKGRIFKFDILNLSTWTMGVMGCVFSEDLLPHLTDDEALVAARNCQALAPIVVHMVTERGQNEELNYHPTEYWMNLTNQPTISLEGM